MIVVVQSEFTASLKVRTDDAKPGKGVAGCVADQRAVAHLAAAKTHCACHRLGGGTQIERRALATAAQLENASRRAGRSQSAAAAEAQYPLSDDRAVGIAVGAGEEQRASATLGQSPRRGVLGDAAIEHHAALNVESCSADQIDAAIEGGVPGTIGLVEATGAEIDDVAAGNFEGWIGCSVWPQVQAENGEIRAERQRQIVRERNRAALPGEGVGSVGRPRCCRRPVRRIAHGTGVRLGVVHRLRGADAEGKGQQPLDDAPERGWLIFYFHLLVMVLF